MREEPRRNRQKVAVIGSGVAGLTAAYLAQRRHDVTLFEADDRLGGHAHTHDVEGSGGRIVPVDSGFIVHNDRTYPQLRRLFAELGVVTQETEMSLSVNCRHCGLEYAGARGAKGVFARRTSITDQRFLRMLTEIPRFHRQARELLVADDADGLTLAGFLSAGGFSRYFAMHFIVPLVAAVWSSGTGDALRYPALYLLRFLGHHGMLTITGSPRWRTVMGGSRTYVERAAKGLTAVRTATPVRSITRFPDHVDVRSEADEVESFDQVVIATHADQALGLLADPTPAERDILGSFRYSVNEAVLHTDDSLLPSARRARASWNYVVRNCDEVGGDRPETMITYDLTRLQRLSATPADPRYLVSLGAGDDVDPNRVITRMRYEHPVYTPDSVAAARRSLEITNGRTAFAGAWQGWGFHEDGCASGVRAAAALGVRW